MIADYLRRELDTMRERKRELAQLPQLISYLNEAAMDASSANSPIKRRIDMIRSEIKATHVTIGDHQFMSLCRRGCHHTPEDCRCLMMIRQRGDRHDGMNVIRLNRDKAEARYGMWAELDRISEVHGPKLNEERNLWADFDSAERAKQRLLRRQEDSIARLKRMRQQRLRERRKVKKLDKRRPPPGDLFDPT